MHVHSSVKPFPFLLFITLLTALFSCSQQSDSGKKQRPSFKNILGIQFIEVRREFNTGLSFNDQGFQQEPDWKLYFLSEDSVMIYNPVKKVYFHYPVYHDHDSVFNIAREWLRLKEINKDSITFQLLSVDEKKVSQERSNVTMKFYSYTYLKEHLRQDPEKLKHPNRKDSLFIRSKIRRALRNSFNPDSCFAARNPVQFTSTNKNIQVNKVPVEMDKDNLVSSSPSDAYLFPEYSITIHKAYKKFFYTFSVLVDQNGKMRVNKYITSPEFEESRKKVLQGIVDVYLSHYLTLIPGSTLNMFHPSEITLHVRGIVQ
ncbi:hypothetical protein [Arcticibacter eurypsychrophilus]|uniref:hypothetical protein n=1 Tax=Arcticibacter eurypsychrophilus TaxID=1434752 RepID=UPI00084DC2F0|nr:hypothetical protein [Arcticibacter eurypsychrophilus]